jgi:beta-lactamase class A
MTAYLRLPSVRDRGLRQKDRDLLEPMIRWSDNATASRVRDIVGGSRLNALADRAGMRDFSFHYSPWGLSRTSARDQARFMFRLERWIPNRHEAYARRLLRTIVRSQRWGIPPEVPDGWRIFFKGGWGSGTGWVTHQVAFLKNGDRRIAIAILVRDSPNHTYGTRTIRGVARRLLKGL